MILTTDKVIQLEILLTLGTGTKIQKEYLRNLSDEELSSIIYILSELSYLSPIIDKEIDDRGNYE